MPNVAFVVQDGVRYLNVDFTQGTWDTCRDLFPKIKDLIRAEPPNSVFTLTQVVDTVMSPEFSEAFKDVAAFNKPYVKAGAVVGITGIKKIFYQAVVQFTGRKNFKLFDSAAEARQWFKSLT